jgi:hypothetical protein
MSLICWRIVLSVVCKNQKYKTDHTELIEV